MVKTLHEIYKCSVCGNITEVIHVGGGTLVCCGQPMILQNPVDTEHFTDEHILVTEDTDDGTLIKIDITPQSSTVQHYIEWIEVDVINGCSAKHFLQPGEVTEAFFPISLTNIAKIRCYCNIHGLWEKQL